MFQVLVVRFPCLFQKMRPDSRGEQNHDSHAIENGSKIRGPHTDRMDDYSGLDLWWRCGREQSDTHSTNGHEQDLNRKCDDCKNP